MICLFPEKRRTQLWLEPSDALSSGLLCPQPSILFWPPDSQGQAHKPEKMNQDREVKGQ